MKRVNVLISLGVVAILFFGIVPNALGSWVLDGEFRIPGTGSYRGMALTNDEQGLYVTGIQERNVVLIDLSGKTPLITQTTSIGSINPKACGKAVFVATDDRVWVPASDDLEVYEFTADLKLVAIHDIRGLGVSKCEGVLVDGEGNLYLAERSGTAGVVKLKKAEAGWQRDTDWGINGAAELGGEVRCPIIDAVGTIYAGVWGGGTGDKLFKVDQQGNKELVASGIAAPYHLAVDGKGQIYSINYSVEPVLTMIAPTGEVIGTYTKGDLGLKTDGSGIAITKDGQRLFILDQTNISVSWYRWVE
ncbi:MAG: hypothetical protein PHV61_10385 [Limnochordia bacterium]|nr:hypothetical protein [Limnochordia bacterium]MDD4519201.1 hypothetical protein [Limnochordia bacterium]